VSVLVLAALGIFSQRGSRGDPGRDLLDLVGWSELCWCRADWLLGAAVSMSASMHAEPRQAVGALIAPVATSAKAPRAWIAINFGSKPS
jgi:hypothetical protein